MTVQPTSVCNTFRTNCSINSYSYPIYINCTCSAVLQCLVVEVKKIEQQLLISVRECYNGCTFKKNRKVHPEIVHFEQISLTVGRKGCLTCSSIPRKSEFCTRKILWEKIFIHTNQKSDAVVLLSWKRPVVKGVWGHSHGDIMQDTWIEGSELDIDQICAVPIGIISSSSWYSYIMCSL